MSKKEQTSDAMDTSCSCDSDALASVDHRYDSMVLSCIDPRMQKPVYKYLKHFEEEGKKDLSGNYSQVTIAGAAIGAVASKFEAWHQTFWDNLDISLGLHKISRVIVVQHRDCGAAKEAYGHFVPGSEEETKLHRAVVADFERELTKRHPQLRLLALLMDLDGKVKKLT